jgi:DNA repair and recombination protein RAD54B
MIDTILDAKFDLVVCDEGHRLKDPLTAVNIALSSIDTKKRLILSATPIQNNLVEFYSMVLPFY